MAEAASQEAGSGSIDDPQQPPQQLPPQQQQPDESQQEQHEEQGGQHGQKQEPCFEQGAAGAGGQPLPEIDDPVEAAAGKSEVQAAKVSSFLT